jgi:hypothetical protein
VLDRANNQVKLLIDGEVVATQDATDIGSLNTNGPFALGALDRTGFSGTTEYLEGSMDDVQVYHKALNEDEIATMISGAVADADALTAHYDFDGNEPFVDKSGNGFDLENKNVVFEAEVGANVTYVDTPEAGVYEAGEELTFTVHYDKEVFVEGEPFIELDVGGEVKRAYYQEGSGSDSVTFSFIADATTDLDGVALRNATIQLDGTNKIYDNSKVDGAGVGVTVTGLYLIGSDENLLASVSDVLETLSAHDYFDHNSLGNTGYNYMGGHDWFSEHGIDASTLAGGKVAFSDGTTGIIDVAFDGEESSGENAYIYYSAYEEADVDLRPDGTDATLPQLGEVIIDEVSEAPIDFTDTDLVGTMGDDIIEGSAEAEIIDAQDGNDEITQSGADSIDAGAGDDVVNITDLNFNEIQGGSGDDTLYIEEDLDIDFNDLSSKLHDVEALDLTRADVTLKGISVEDVLDITSEEDERILKITGNENDAIGLKQDEWKKSEETKTDEEGNTYDVYVAETDPTVELQIDQRIAEVDMYDN